MNELFKQWCKETKRGGSVLVGGSIREFFMWLENNGKNVTVTTPDLNFVKWKDQHFIALDKGEYRVKFSSPYRVWLYLFNINKENSPILEEILRIYNIEQKLGKPPNFGFDNKWEAYQTWRNRNVDKYEKPRPESIYFNHWLDSLIDLL